MGMFEFAVIVVLVYFTNARSYACLCNSYQKIELLQDHTSIDAVPFTVIYDIGVMRCAKQCLLRRRCLSFTYDLSSCTCYLNSVNRSMATVSASKTTMYSDIQFWPERLMGYCKEHTCALNEHCAVTRTGVTRCVPNGCLQPPLIENGKMVTDGKDVWSFGETVPYTCKINFYPEGDLACKSDGSWSTVLCYPPLEKTLQLAQTVHV